MIAVAMVAIALAVAVVAQGCGDRGPRLHALASLPDEISACGRTWVKDGLRRQQTLAEVREASGVEPVVVDPGLLTPCPAGACTAEAASTPCHTVIFVRVGEDAYLDYALSGGP